MQQYGTCTIGEGTRVFEPVILGFPSLERMSQKQFPGTVVGKNGVIRSGTVIYCDVNIGDFFSSGHNVLIREKTTMGDHVAVGSATIIEGNCIVGNNVRIQSMVFIPTHTCIGSEVFIGPNAILTNDRYPPTGKPALKGPVLEDYAVIGANATILPGITIGRGSAVAAASVVTKDVPPGFLALGSPARLKPLPKEMKRI